MLRQDHFEKFMDKSMGELKDRMITTEDERGEMKNLISKSYEYTDQRVNALKSAIPITIDELGSEIERKMESINDDSRLTSQKTFVELKTNIGEVGTRVDTLERVFQEKLSQVEQGHKLEIKALHERLDNLTRNKDSPDVGNLQNELRTCKDRLAGYESELGKTNRKLDEALLKIQKLAGENTFETVGKGNTCMLEQKRGTIRAYVRH